MFWRRQRLHPFSFSSHIFPLVNAAIFFLFLSIFAAVSPIDAQHFQQEHHFSHARQQQQQQPPSHLVFPRIIRQQPQQQIQWQQRQHQRRINAAATAAAERTPQKSIINEGGRERGGRAATAAEAQLHSIAQQQQQKLHPQRRNAAAGGAAVASASVKPQTSVIASLNNAAAHQPKNQQRRQLEQHHQKQQQQQQRARAKGYTTDERGGQQVQVVELDCAAPATAQCDLSSAGPNFNPALTSGGIPGAPGIIARLNQRAFQYLSQIAGGVLNYMIKRARLPNISQCIPQVNGCINVYNLYVSRYRCPQRVTVYPAPPNQLVVDVQNLDIGVTGNLGGQIVILLPLALFGIVQVNAHQVSVRVSVTIACGPDGGPVLRMLSCAASVGYVDVYIQNGGLIGDIANSQFRGKISEMVRQQIPGQLCQRLPGILDQEVNSKLSSQIPRRIPLSQLLQIAINAFGLGNLLGGGGGGQCPAACNAKKAAALAAAQQSNSTVLLLPPHLQSNGTTQQQQQQQQSIALLTPLNGTGTATAGAATTLLVANGNNGTNHNNNNIHDSLIPPRPNAASVTQRPATLAAVKEKHHQDALGKGNRDESGGTTYARKTLNRARGTLNTDAGGNAPLLLVSSSSSSNQTLLQLQQGRTMLIAPLAPHAQRPRRAAQMLAAAALMSTAHIGGNRSRNNRATPSESGRLSFVDPGENLCGNCPASGQQESPLGFLAVILQSMDLSKLNQIYLDVSLLCDQTVATDHDFTIQLRGEFSVCGHGCTPFGAFPMHFPDCVGCKMVEILISDFTINSLFYHLHNIGFLRVRIGPETPKIGELLKTTCGTETEDETELEDHGVENEDGTVVMAAAASKTKARRRRQDMGDFSSLGICLGDILPAVRERYPNERVYIVISTQRAPSVMLSSRNGGLATLDFVINADFFIESTNQKVGTIRIAAVIDVTVRPRGNHITAHADISYLNLQDVGNQLGLPQDALDNLGNLGKELILKAGNDALERGTSLNIPNGIGGLPINIIDPEFHILDHALLIQTDFTLNPNALGGSEPC